MVALLVAIGVLDDEEGPKAQTVRRVEAACTARDRALAKAEAKRARRRQRRRRLAGGRLSELTADDVRK